MTLGQTTAIPLGTVPGLETTAIPSRQLSTGDTHLCCGVSVSNHDDIHLAHNGPLKNCYGAHPYCTYEQYNLGDLPPPFLENDVSEAHIENATSQ